MSSSLFGKRRGSYGFIPLIVIALLFGVYLNVTLGTGSPNVFTSTTANGRALCTTSIQNVPTSNPLYINEDTSLQVCVRYFYYNASATLAFNFSSGQQIYVTGCCYQHASFDAKPNFTVSSSVGIVTFGGRDNLSEGTMVNYTITPRQGINGTYGFNFGALYPSMEACGEDFLIAIGNGLPNYGYPFEGCTAPLSNFYPVNSRGYVDGFLLVQIVGVSNST